MGGGCYNYAHYKISDIIELLENDLPDRLNKYVSFEPEELQSIIVKEFEDTLYLLNSIVVRLQELENYMSGDIDGRTYTENINKTPYAVVISEREYKSLMRDKEILDEILRQLI